MSEEINDVVAKADNIVDSKIIQKLNQDKDKHDDDMIKILKMGCELFKYKRNGKKYKRHFYLDPDELTIKYTGSRKFWRAQKLVEIPDIKEIRMGPNTHTFRALANKVKANLAFSLILGNKHDSLDLVAKSPEIKDQWISALRYVVSRYKNMEQEKEHEKWAIDHFNKADINKDGGLSFEETLQLLNHMNINMDKRYAKKLFDVSDINMTRTKTGEDVLDQKEFLNFYRLLIRRPEIVDIIHKYSKNGSSFLEPEELQEFMIKEQKQNDINLEQCKKLIQTYDKTTKEGTMSIEGMRCMLVSRDQALFNKNYLELYQDMTRPLSDYYINSSHNTYLSEDQLIGESSVENYIKALREGCRCVEIDVWNGVDGDPIVYHGHTLTAMIKFVDIIKAISTYAFETSPYPLILSLENHCSIDQQKLMAHYLKTILGDKIYAEEIMEGDFLPSPESLKERYVIKGKMLDIPYKSEEVVSEEDEAAEIDSEIVLKDLKKKPQSKMIKLAKELSDLTFLRSTHFKGVGQRGKCNCICSFSELKAISMISEDARLFADYNTTNLSRIYPNGIRTDSSNFDPMLFWKAGCQIVAMNYQSDDKKMQLYHAKFRDNGGMGYLLKPDYLLSNYDETSPTERQEKLLKLKIISAQQLPKPYRNVHDKDVIDPYVKIEVIGFKTTQKAKTSIIANNGFNPVWNEAFEFVIDDPQSAILRFVVKDFNSSSKNDFIGQFTIPFKCLMEGYHHAHLQNKKCNAIPPATLFMYTKIEDFKRDNLPELSNYNLLSQDNSLNKEVSQPILNNIVMLDKSPRNSRDRIFKPHDNLYKGPPITSNVLNHSQLVKTSNPDYNETENFEEMYLKLSTKPKLLTDLDTKIVQGEILKPSNSGYIESENIYNNTKGKMPLNKYPKHLHITSTPNLNEIDIKQIFSVPLYNKCLETSLDNPSYKDHFDFKPIATIPLNKQCNGFNKNYTHFSYIYLHGNDMNQDNQYINGNNFYKIPQLSKYKQELSYEI